VKLPQSIPPTLEEEEPTSTICPACEGLAKVFNRYLGKREKCSLCKGKRMVPITIAKAWRDVKAWTDQL
jgi:uncharacterized protein (DUF983 family)